MNRFEVLIRKLFALSILCKVEHANARGIGSYARHVAIGSFGEKVDSHTDSLIEYLMGQGKLISVEAGVVEVASDIVKEVDSVVSMYESLAIGDEALVNMSASFKEDAGKLKYLLLLQ